MLYTKLMPPQTFLLMGRSGCGKGTQAAALKKHLEGTDEPKRAVYNFEVGEHVREFLKGVSHSSKLSREIYSRDDRQPAYIAIWMWSQFFIKDLTGEEHLIVDGACRSILEAQIFGDAMNFYKRRANIIYLEVGREAALERLLLRGKNAGRADDASAERIGKRLDWFERDATEAVEYFKKSKNHNFITIDGEKDIPGVTAEILEKISVFE